MGRTTGRLTALKVARAKQPGMYADGGGLNLQVTAGGASWIYRFMLNGRAREMGLGPLDLYGLPEARALALEARKLRHQGIDPIEARRAQRQQALLEAAKAITFDECAGNYIAAHHAGWRNKKHAGQWQATLRDHAGPVIGALPVADVDTALVLKVLQPLWTAIPETAARLRGRIESVLDWARVRGFREGENPARWRGHLDHLLPARSKVRKVEHYPALPWSEIGAFMATLRDQGGNAARALEFTILTAARTSEVIGARWSEIDLTDKTWTVPAARMKAARLHRVPLSARALDILRAMQAHHDGNDGFVFPGERPGKALSHVAMLKVLQQTTGCGGVTVHGFRSSFRDWAAETTSYPNHVIEQALAHAIGGKVEAAYRRGDLFAKRCRLMESWATFCATARVTDSNVAALRQAS